ncbi:MAG: chemotaxis protein chel [Rhodomicrobium sp.]|nr:chemotaxis protein chel [Rhodomicrobium sp.]
MNALPPITSASPLPAAAGEPRDARLIENAKAFEAVFVAQMLSHSGLAEAVSANGGFGGEAYSSALIEQYAEKLVEQGGFGLAEKIYEQLLAKEDSLHVGRANA